ncbi:hypothetical protein QBC43DRAFT_380935 [Cladorrhinum sp. PSN259]|nr:hypothetical protein QBC43DRAFT_380935 [Cladorrhinum sp. PSN259]
MLCQVLAVLFATEVALAAPLARVANNTCTNPQVRKACHTLSRDEKMAYKDAELCLMSKPATLGLPEIAHSAGQFLPFHRLYVRAHEHALFQECGYTGAQPYWDETLDAGAFSQAIIFDDDVGFGGDGVGPSKCIQTGPFANYINSLGPGYNLTDHCIQRQINDTQSRYAAKKFEDACLAKDTFLQFWPCLEGTPHGAGHAGVGAQMLNGISSPGDPLFFLHHAWLDRMWAKWQDEDPEVRLYEIGDNNRRLPEFGGGPPPDGTGGFDPPISFDEISGGGFVRPENVPEPVVVGDLGNTTMLNQVLQMYGIIPNSTIAEVMNTWSAILCYGYE